MGVCERTYACLYKYYRACMHVVLWVLFLVSKVGMFHFLCFTGKLTAAHLVAAEERLQRELQDSSSAFLINDCNTLLPVMPQSSGEVSAGDSATVVDRFQPQAAKTRTAGSQHGPLVKNNASVLMCL